MLKPGGILGVVDHRLPEDMDSALEEKSGYIKKSSVVGFAKAAGFELVDKSSVNANPKDSHDWPEGVWTLPPTLKKGDRNSMVKGKSVSVRVDHGGRGIIKKKTSLIQNNTKI